MTEGNCKDKYPLQSEKAGSLSKTIEEGFLAFDKDPARIETGQAPLTPSM